MPWINKVKPYCKCPTPEINLKEFGLGSVWQCDNCGKKYVLKDNQREGTYWEIQATWDNYPDGNNWR